MSNIDPSRLLDTRFLDLGDHAAHDPFPILDER
jgi:hypothetical protein